MGTSTQILVLLGSPGSSQHLQRLFLIRFQWHLWVYSVPQGGPQTPWGGQGAEPSGPDAGKLPGPLRALQGLTVEVRGRQVSIGMFVEQLHIFKKNELRTSGDYNRSIIRAFHT